MFKAKKILDSEQVTFRVVNHLTENVFTANVYYGGVNIKYKMIELGWYKHDYRVDRDKYSVLMQKKAKCMGLGVWQGDMSYVTDVECN